MNYWSDLFTGTTWKEFRDAGGTISGFGDRNRNQVSKIKPGDVLLCYLTGVMRWIGALEVLGKSDDMKPIWSFGDFPIRLKVKPLVILNPENGVPMENLAGKVSFYADSSDAGKFKGFVRGSPNLFKKQDDGELILRLLKEAELNPVNRPVDSDKLNRKPILYKAESQIDKKKVEVLVSIPDVEKAIDETDALGDEKEGATQHSEIQHLLLKLGSDMGLDVWAANNNRTEMQKLGDIQQMLDKLPLQFNEATQRTIELIDVLWLKNNTIVSAFEVEATTSIYSGLLRMSDLMALQPNIDIRLFLIAPDERQVKVEREIRRLTFQMRPKPLQKICGFIPFSRLRERVKGIYNMEAVGSLSPDYLQKIAIYFE